MMNLLTLRREPVECALCGHFSRNIFYSIDTAGIRYARIWIEGSEQRVQSVESIVKCESCGLIYVSPRLVRTPDLGTYSAEEERAYFESTHAVRRCAFRDFVMQMPGWLGRAPESLLDIGCGDGALLEVAAAAGIESQGTEISETLLRQVRERLGDQAVQAGGLDGFRNEQFDVVTLINVLEHVQDPNATLQEAARVLKPDGILAVHTINIGGLPARLARQRWYHIEPFNHLYYYTADTLVRLMRKNDLVACGRFSLIIAHGVRATMQRSLNRVGIYMDNGLGVVARRKIKHA